MTFRSSRVRNTLLTALALPLVISLGACSPESETATVTAGTATSTSSNSSPSSTSSTSPKGNQGESSSQSATSEATNTLPENFKAVGNEPFWAVQVTGNKAVYTDPENQSGTTYTATRKGMSLTSKDFSLTLEQKECSDGMSDKQYDYIATLDVGGKQLNGCASAS